MAGPPSQGYGVAGPPSQGYGVAGKSGTGIPNCYLQRGIDRLPRYCFTDVTQMLDEATQSQRMHPAKEVERLCHLIEHSL